MSREQIIDIIRSILSANKINKAALFGSFARNEKNYKDIDILIETNGHTMFDVLRLEKDLQQNVHSTIDLVEYSALKKTIRDRVLNESISIL